MYLFNVRRSLLFSMYALLAPVELTTAQRLVALNDGTPAKIQLIDPRFCDITSSCSLSTSTGIPIASISSYFGGVAVDRASGARWFTTGPNLYRVRPDCATTDEWSIGGSAWTGLALHPGRGLLYFTDGTSVGQVPIPASGSGSVNMASAILQPLSAPVTLFATGVEYDPDFDALWICDVNYGVSLVPLPASGAGVLRHYNVSTYCGTTLHQPLEGITLDPRRQVPGHSRGVLFVSDQSNIVLKLDRDGLEIGCCSVAGLSPALAGLAYLPASSSTRFGQGSHSSGGVAPSITESAAPELGESWSLGVAGAASQAVAIEFLDVDPFSLSLGWGTLYVRPNPLPLPPMVVSASGSASRSWNLPLELLLRGGAIRAQIMVLEPSGALALSEGLLITLR